MTHKEYADGLRAIADFFEQHEEIGLPHDAEYFSYFSAQTKEEMALLSRALGSCNKKYGDWQFILSRNFGAVTFRAIVSREQICKRVVVGKKAIPGHVLPAKPEEYIPAHEEDVIEWQCDEPLLESPFPDGHDMQVESEMEREARDRA
jgi:hypothetical protein